MERLPEGPQDRRAAEAIQIQRNCGVQQSGGINTMKMRRALLILTLLWTSGLRITLAASTTLSTIRIRLLSMGDTTLFRLLIPIAGLLFVNTASAADFGFGASFKSGESSIYLPVHATKNFMIEPYFRLMDREFFAVTSRTSVEDTAIGVGLFGVFHPVENASAYLGVRTAYLNQEQETEQIIIDFFGSTVITTRTELDGYSIAPTLGFEYYIVNRLTIGAEVAWEFSKVDASASVDINSIPVPANADAELKSNNTRTNIILRFYF